MAVGGAEQREAAQWQVSAACAPVLLPSWSLFLALAFFIGSCPGLLELEEEHLKK